MVRQVDQVTTLIEFLEERLREDEATARAAANDAEGVAPGELGPWVVGADTGDHLNPTTVFRPSSWSGHIVHACNTEYAGHEAIPVARHIAWNSPARVLREVAAKRELLDRYATSERSAAGTLANDSDVYYAEALEEAVRILAEVYSDHMDFREEWAA